jgi:hypothetical protein
VKEPPFLFVVQRQIGGVPVEHDLGGSRLVRLDEHADRQFIHRLLPEHDFLVAVSYAGTQFHPVQRTLARQRFGQIPLAGQNAEHRVRAQLLVIVEVFAAEGKTVNSLPEHLSNRMLHQRPIPAVGNSVMP